jgi:hypothetical protein
VTVFATGVADKMELTDQDGLKGVKEGTPVRGVHADAPGLSLQALSRDVQDRRTPAVPRPGRA